MTNILYFDSAVRDGDSVSSYSHDEQTSEDGQVGNVGESSLFSIIGQACMACAWPQVALRNDDHTISETTAVDDHVLDAPVAGNFCFCILALWSLYVR